MPNTNGEEWQAFSKASPAGLLRIATMCDASYLDPETGLQRNALGPSGVAVAQEIFAYLESLKGTPKRKKAPKKEVAPENKGAEIAIIEAFKACSIEAIGRPPVLRYGTDRLHIRRAITSGWPPDDIVDMIPAFFQEKDNPFVFLKGDIKSFIQSLSRLAANATSPNGPIESTVHIPNQEIDATTNI
jgi:hypothetical protein